MSMEQEYDAFLSYKSTDKPAVREVAILLKERGITVWLDEWELAPGAPWQEGIEQGLEKSKTVVVFIGPAGIGSWETPEMQVALDLQVQRKIRVIPVILPGVDPNQVQLSAFLRRNTWVQLSQHLNDAAELDRLEWGITGVNPNPISKQRTVARQSDVAARNTDPVDEAIKTLAGFLQSGNVTFFLGRGISDASLSSPCEISRELLASLRLID